jgi:hypothetical protein
VRVCIPMPLENPAIEIETVQHPALGPLKFPRAMPFEQRNQLIEELENQQKASMAGGANPANGQTSGFIDPLKEAGRRNVQEHPFLDNGTRIRNDSPGVRAPAQRPAGSTAGGLFPERQTSRNSAFFSRQPSAPANGFVDPLKEAGRKNVQEHPFLDYVPLEAREYGGTSGLSFDELQRGGLRRFNGKLYTKEQRAALRSAAVPLTDEDRNQYFIHSTNPDQPPPPMKVIYGTEQELLKLGIPKARIVPAPQVEGMSTPFTPTYVPRSQARRVNRVLWEQSVPVGKVYPYKPSIWERIHHAVVPAYVDNNIDHAKESFAHAWEEANTGPFHIGEAVENKVHEADPDSKVLAGVGRGAGDFLDSIVSPAGLLTLGGSSALRAPRAVRAASKAYWAAQMAKGAYHHGDEVVRGILEDDPEKIAHGTTGLAFDIPMGAHMARGLYGEAATGIRNATNSFALEPTALERIGRELGHEFGETPGSEKPSVPQDVQQNVAQPKTVEPKATQQNTPAVAPEIHRISGETKPQAPRRSSVSPPPLGEIRLQPPGATGMEAQARAVERQAIDLARNHADEIDRRYAQLKDTYQGSHFDADEYKKVLYPEWDEQNPDRQREIQRRYSTAVHNSSSMLAENRFNHYLEAHDPADGKSVVQIYTGMAGAGKSSALRQARVANVAASFGGNFSDFSRLERFVDQVLSSGHVPEIIHTHIDPLIAFDRMVVRGMDTGRFVPLQNFVDMADIDSKVLRASKELGVKVNVYDNSGTESRKIPLDELDNSRYRINAEKLTEQLKERARGFWRQKLAGDTRFNNFTRNDYRIITGDDPPEDDEGGDPGSDGTDPSHLHPSAGSRNNPEGDRSKPQSPRAQRGVPAQDDGRRRAQEAGATTGRSPQSEISPGDTVFLASGGKATVRFVSVAMGVALVQTADGKVRTVPLASIRK